MPVNCLRPSTAASVRTSARSPTNRAEVARACAAAARCPGEHTSSVYGPAGSPSSSSASATHAFASAISSSVMPPSRSRKTRTTGLCFAPASSTATSSSPWDAASGLERGLDAFSCLRRHRRSSFPEQKKRGQAHFSRHTMSFRPRDSTTTARAVKGVGRRAERRSRRGALRRRAAAAPAVVRARQQRSSPRRRARPRARPPRRSARSRARRCARCLSSTTPSATPRFPTTTWYGQPMRSASANFTPARSSRSSRTTSTPRFGEVGEEQVGDARRPARRRTAG